MRLSSSTGGDTYWAQPQVVVDVCGNATAVWNQDDGQRQNFWTSHYSGAAGIWDTAVLVENDAQRPQVTVDARGNVTAVWRGPRSSISSNRFSVTTGKWDASVRIESAIGDYALPQLAGGASGDAMAVWAVFSDQETSRIQASRKGVGGAWGPAALIDTVGCLAVPQLAADPSGNAMAVWGVQEYAASSVWASRYDLAAGTWVTGPIAQSSSSTFVRPAVAMDHGGSAIVVWSDFGVWAIRYEAGVWGLAERIDDGGGANVAMDSSGNATVVFGGAPGPSVQGNNIWAKRYSVTTRTWSKAVLLGPSGWGGERPQLAVAANGIVTVVWLGPKGELWAKRCDPNGVWGNGLSIASEANDPQLAADPSGNATVIWRQRRERGIWVRRLE